MGATFPEPGYSTIRASRRRRNEAVHLGRSCRSTCTTAPTHATLALEAGIHPKVVSECRGGAATVSITLDTYSHAIPAIQEEAAALIAGPVLAE